MPRAKSTTTQAKSATTKPKGKQPTVTIESLTKLGAKRLAALLFEAADKDPALAKFLRVELLKSDPEALAREIDKQIASLKRARGFVDWRKIRELAKTLEALRASIAGPLIEADATLGIERLLAFLALGDTTAGRADDSNGLLKPIFTDACTDFASAIGALHPDLQFQWASLGYAMVDADGYGLLDALPGAIISRLANPALTALRQSLTEKYEALPPEDPDQRRYDYRPTFLLTSLAAIADAQGDVDAFIAAHMRKSPRLRDDAGIAIRLMRAGRAQEAFDHLNTVDPSNILRMTPIEDARIDVLDALGRKDDAQAERWRAFERRLSTEPLRAYLKRLPDFDADEKLEQALAFAARQELSRALVFMLEWPALREAGALVRARSRELNGDLYHIYTPAAEALEAKDPLAATLLRRAMIDFTLERARSSRYEHAARHLVECGAIAGQVTDWQGVPDHDAYLAKLRAAHSRKTGFWTRVMERGGDI